MKDVFPLNENSFYKSSKKRTLGSRHFITAHFGSEKLSHLALKIWDLLPEWVKNLESVVSFKNAIEKWKPANCVATYVEHIYFRLALCHYFIIQSEAFSRISFVNILYCKYLYST